MSVTDRQLEILQHALGVDQFGQGRQYRNHFCAGEADVEDCKALVAAGLMKRHQTTELFPYYNASVTEIGVQYVAENSPKPPKLTRGQLRYRRYLDVADAYDCTFREFLDIEKERLACR